MKFDNNRPSSFEDYVSNKNRHRRQTDKQADRLRETGDYFFRTLCSMGHEMSRKHKSGHSSDGLDYYTSLAYTPEEKINPFNKKMIMKSCDSQTTGSIIRS